MNDLRSKFKSCGENVVIEKDVSIEHPETIEVGDNVVFEKGFTMKGLSPVCEIGSNVTFRPDVTINANNGDVVVGDHVTIGKGVYIVSGNGGFEIGHHSHTSHYCVMQAQGGLKIGAYCNIAMFVALTTVGHDHTVKNRPMAGTMKAGPIVLEDDVWLGASVTITSNTRIATGCVIAANAAVVKDTEPRGIYGGVPAKRIKDR